MSSQSCESSDSHPTALPETWRLTRLISDGFFLFCFLCAMKKDNKIYCKSLTTYIGNLQCSIPKICSKKQSQWKSSLINFRWNDAPLLFNQPDMDLASQGPVPPFWNFYVHLPPPPFCTCAPPPLFKPKKKTHKKHINVSDSPPPFGTCATLDADGAPEKKVSEGTPSDFSGHQYWHSVSNRPTMWSSPLTQGYQNQKHTAP